MKKRTSFRDKLGKSLREANLTRSEATGLPPGCSNRRLGPVQCEGIRDDARATIKLLLSQIGNNEKDAPGSR